MYENLVNWLVNQDYSFYQTVKNTYVMILVIIISSIMFLFKNKLFSLQFMLTQIFWMAFVIFYFIKFSLSPFTQAENIFKQYSEEQLSGLYLSSNLNLYKTDNKNLALGKVSMRPDSKKEYLGEVNCKDLSFKKCVDEVSQNQDKIVLSLKDAKTYVINSK